MWGAGLKKGFRATKGYRHCGFSATEKNLIVTCSGWHLGYGWWSLFQQCLIHIVSFWDRTVAQKVSASISAATAKEGSGDGLNAREQGSVFFSCGGLLLAWPESQRCAPQSLTRRFPPLSRDETISTGEYCC